MKAIFLTFCLFVFSSCSKEQLEKSPTILVTIPPYAYLVEKIAGQTVDVQTLVPPGANPHIFEPTPRQVESAFGSKIWFTIGDPFERKLLKVFKEKTPSLQIISMTQNVPLIESTDHHHEGHDHDDFDRHIWLSLRLAKIEAQTIADALSATFPENRSFFEENLSLFLAELEDEDADITAQLQPFKGQAILTSHPAFSYFCNDYGLQQLSVEVEGKDPRPQQIHELLEAAKREQVRTVLLQPQYNNKGAEIIAHELNLPMYTIDPYALNFVNTIHEIAEIIAHH